MAKKKLAKKKSTEPKNAVMSVVIDGVEYVPAPACPQEPEPAEDDCLRVTHVTVYPFKLSVDKSNHIRGVAEIVLNDQLIVRGLRVMDGVNGLFVSYPNDPLNGLFVSYPNDPFYKGADYRSIVCPITKQLLRVIEKVVLTKYQEAIK